ncbi:MAG TPA: TetR/AcrR family transcriptional regulator [Kofleriaceae bacterium]
MRMPKATPAPRRLPKSRHAAVTVDAILISVERILEQDGPTALTTNRIADVAGVSIGTLYQYFPNKEALVGALQDKYAEDTLSRVRDVLAGAEELPMNVVIARIAEALLSANQAQRPIHRWLIDWRTVTGGNDRYRQALDQHVELVADFLARRKDLTIRDPRAAAFVLVHACEGVIEAVTERHADIDVTAIAMHGIRMVTLFVV